MVAPVKASKKVALGRTTWWAVPTITSMTAPLATEVNSASGLNISGFILAEQDLPTGDTGKTSLPRLLLETVVTQTLEPTTFTLPTFRFLWDPQAASGAADKKAWAMFGAGWTGFLVRRQNAINSVSDAVTAAQFVDVFAAIANIGVPTETSSGADAVYAFDVDFGVTATPTFNVAVA